MEADLALALRAVPDLDWSGESQATIPRWLPLVRVSNSGLWIGLDPGARWVVGRPSGQAEIASDRLGPSWLVVLDHDESDIEAELREAAVGRALPADKLVGSLPLDDIVTLGLLSHSEHWAGRAIAWLKRRPARREQLEIVAAIAVSGWASQQTRHLADQIANGRFESR